MGVVPLTLLKGFIKNIKLKDEFYLASLLSLFSSILSQGGAFLAFALLARQMGEHDFGAFSIIYSSVLFLSVISIFGGTVPLTKQLAELHEKKDYDNAERVIIFSTLTSLILLTLISTYILIFKENATHLLLGSPTLSVHLTGLLGLLFCYTLYTVQINILIGLKAYKEYFYSSLGRFLFAFSPVWGYSLFNLNGSIWFFALGFFASSLLNMQLLSRKKRELSKICGVNSSKYKLTFKDYLDKAGVFVIPFFLGSLLTYLIAWLTNRLLVEMPNGYNELGKFNSIFQLRNLTLFIPNAIGNVVLPIIASAFIKEDFIIVRKTFKLFLWGSCAVAAVATLFVISLSDIIIAFFGSKYGLSIRLIIVVSLTIFMATIQLVYGVFLNSIGKMWTGFILNLVWAIVLVAIFAVLPHYNGYDGSTNLAYSYFLSYAIIWLFQATLVNYYIRKLKIK